MADSFSQFEWLIRESVAPGVVNLILPNDDVATHLIGLAQPISVAGRMTNAAGTSDEGAAGWEASWRVRQQRGGRVTGGRIGSAELVTRGANSDLVVGQVASDVYLDPALTPQRSYFQIKMKLKRARGQVTANQDQIDLRTVAESVEDVAMDYIEDAVTSVRKFFNVHFWSDGTGTLAKFSATGTVYEAAGSIAAVAIKDGTPFRFCKGERYVVTDSSYVLKGTMHCVDVDPDTREVFFQSVLSGGDISVVDGDRIITDEVYDFDNGVSLASQGIENLVVATGTFPSTNYSVTDKRELKGFVRGDESNLVNPTPERIAELIDLQTDAGIDPVKVLVAEQSLWTLYAQIERQSSANYPVQQGAPFTANGGVDGPNFTHGGRSFARLSSSLCRPGAIHGLTPESFKRFIPLGDRTIKWATSNGGSAGAPSVFHPIYEGRQLTRTMAADFDVYYEHGLENPRQQFRRIGFYSQRTANAA